MKNNKSYPEELFEQRLQRYRSKKRTKLPHQVQAETGKRVNSLQRSVFPGFAFPDDVLTEPPGGMSGVHERLPVDLFDPFINYDEVTGRAVIKGRCGNIILDESVSMADAARFFLDYIQNESCGQCTFCRVGTKRMMEIVNRLCNGHGTYDDIEALEELADQISSASLCEVGKLAAKPVLSSLRFLRSEYEERT
jgi:NADH:ubiquinone oxidoreductase subunit F (NADH-binding)